MLCGTRCIFLKRIVCPSTLLSKTSAMSRAIYLFHLFIFLLWQMNSNTPTHLCTWRKNSKFVYPFGCQSNRRRNAGCGLSRWLGRSPDTRKHINPKWDAIQFVKAGLIQQYLMSIPEEAREERIMEFHCK